MQVFFTCSLSKHVLYHPPESRPLYLLASVVRALNSWIAPGPISYRHQQTDKRGSRAHSHHSNHHNLNHPPILLVILIIIFIIFILPSYHHSYRGWGWGWGRPVTLESPYTSQHTYMHFYRKNLVEKVPTNYILVGSQYFVSRPSLYPLYYLIFILFVFNHALVIKPTLCFKFTF